jgi:hypothetical protein
MQTTSTAERVGALALAATGALHLILAPEYLEEKTYVGALFIAGGLVSLALAAAIWRRGNPTEWVAAAAVAAGMGIGFVLSRTTGLPGFHEAEWELSGVISLLLEATVIAAAVRSLAGQQPRLAQAR